MGANESLLSSIPNSKKLVINEKMIENIPADIPIPKGILLLDLSRNQVRKLPPKLNSLQILSISNNLLTELTPQMCDSILSYKKLEVLDLSVNELREIDSRILNMKHLKKLCLFENKFEQINIENTKLLFLDVGHNKLKQIPKIPKTLTNLSLSYNLFTSLDEAMPQLTRLALSMCKLDNINPNLVFPNLEILEISLNRLKELPDMTKFAPKLKILDASDNQISTLPFLSKAISTLVIRRNKIETIPEYFSSLISLINLDISFNKLHRIEHLPNRIESLSIASNPVSYFEPFHSASLKTFFSNDTDLLDIPLLTHHCITEMYFQRMEIVNLVPDSFSFSEITKIDFTSNNIKEFPIFLSSLPNLRTLCLAGNNLSMIPDEILNFKFLDSLILSSNPISKLPQRFPPIKQLALSFCCLKGSITCIPDTCTNFQATNNEITDLCVPPYIEVLLLSCNSFENFQFDRLPPTIISLDLSFNSISELPNIFDFPNLIDFYISNNQIASLPSTWNTPNLASLSLAFNPITGTIATNARSMIMADIVGTKILSIQDTVREIFTDNPKQGNTHMKCISSNSKAGYSEMRGVRKSMEDSIIVRSNILDGIDVYSIFDGHGGFKTSTYSTRRICSLIQENSATFRFNSEWVGQMFSVLNSILKKRKFFDGSTAVLAMKKEREIIFAHLGDARALIVTKTGQVKRFTKDHKPTDRGEYERIHSEGGRVVNGRTQGILAVSRSLGDFLVPGISSAPEVEQFEIDEEDKWLILACDGVFDVLSNEAIAEIAVKETSPIKLAVIIRNLSFALQSQDNISVIVVDIS